MFVPEVCVGNGEQFLQIYKKSKVKLYQRKYNYYSGPQLQLQCFDGTCVFTHKTPQFRADRFEFFGETRQFEKRENESFKEKEKRRHEESKKIVNEILEKYVKPLNAIEGEFVSCVLIAQESESLA